ncbi:MAG: L-threonylcarbamoyladenylate synthase [Candidatus Treponema excrementipullorum]|uniref:L-threonylcarbamoyladenylate synthase n=1 Tax=Candidatus Treponema excrementipullorum TaxID=2838768 RepID=A0A9E2L4T5_9SPIR|nr:threonylcarbamoyl-AMP synthase [Candidatus Treponema excrementipullorum]MDY2755404.1 L-threonylcarbamoyladenylate synthase [Candidatus Treponema excrementipullorum]MDY4466569.1 L-threonylcarbamoyladenylate synthase [Candidatus Treponema excrementipullorum]
MIILRSDSDSVECVSRVLLEGSVVVLPTDTVYGFSGVVPESEDVIRKIKGRDETKPFIQLIAEPEDIYRYTDEVLPDQLLAMWPGALTVIVPLKKRLITGESEVTTVAFRCPGDGWLRQIIKAVGKPIYSTSVNRSGQPVLSSVLEIDKEFGGEVKLIVDGGSTENALPSTLVKFEKGKCIILRQGDVCIPSSLLL